LIVPESPLERTLFSLVLSIVLIYWKAEKGTGDETEEL
jgi:hypothetical protein